LEFKNEKTSTKRFHTNRINDRCSGILASIALPAYQDYIARSQASESVVLLDGARTAAEDFVMQEGVFPGAADVTVTTAGQYGTLALPTARATVPNGSITYTFKASGGVNSQLLGDTVTYTRNASGAWSCGNTGIPPKLTPKGC